MMKFSIIINPFEENAKFAEYFLDLFTFFLLESLIKYVHIYIRLVLSPKRLSACTYVVAFIVLINEKTTSLSLI